MKAEFARFGSTGNIAADSEMEADAYHASESRIGAALNRPQNVLQANSPQHSDSSLYHARGIAAFSGNT